MIATFMFLFTTQKMWIIISPCLYLAVRLHKKLVLLKLDYVISRRGDIVIQHKFSMHSRECKKQLFGYTYIFSMACNKIGLPPS